MGALVGWRRSAIRGSDRETNNLGNVYIRCLTRTTNISDELPHSLHAKRTLRFINPVETDEIGGFGRYPAV